MLWEWVKRPHFVYCSARVKKPKPVKAKKVGVPGFVREVEKMLRHEYPAAPVAYIRNLMDGAEGVDFDSFWASCMSKRAKELTS